MFIGLVELQDFLKESHIPKQMSTWVRHLKNMEMIKSGRLPAAPPLSHRRPWARAQVDSQHLHPPSPLLCQQKPAPNGLGNCDSRQRCSELGAFEASQRLGHLPTSDAIHPHESGSVWYDETRT